MSRLAPLLLICMLTACATYRVANGIPNLSEVDAGVWRGGQPTPEGWAHLKAIGITNVIKLNPESEARDDEAVRMGMTVIHCPVSMAQQMGVAKIPKDYFTPALRQVQPGTFIHCKHGQDRTGVFVALYRMGHDGWTNHFAQTEMFEQGFHPELIGLWDFWKDQP